jgi:predicted SnoaL-like aldol condensation-catalyzing enzyme
MPERRRIDAIDAATMQRENKMDLSQFFHAAGLAGALISAPIMAAVPPVGVTDQEALLRSPDPKLAANKRLVFDMWRAIVQGGHVELAPKYVAEDYIQHSPNVPSGRAAMVEFMSRTRPVRPIEPVINFPVVSIVAEGDLVVLATVSYGQDPEDPTRKYATTHFDMFRIADGKIAEHWDNLPKSSALLHIDPNVVNKP